MDRALGAQRRHDLLHPRRLPDASANVAGGRNWSLVHGITRQESSFDRTARQPAGARGLMQLMPGTAREQAGKMGVGYDYGRLTSDPAYNVMLGSAYFQRLRQPVGRQLPARRRQLQCRRRQCPQMGPRLRRSARPGGDIVGWIERIPFEETRGYVQRVLENSVVYDRINPT